MHNIGTVKSLRERFVTIDCSSYSKRWIVNICGHHWTYFDCNLWDSLGGRQWTFWTFSPIDCNAIVPRDIFNRGSIWPRRSTKSARFSASRLIGCFLATSPICALINGVFCLPLHLCRGKDFFPNFYAATGNRTHVGSVASILGILIKEA